MRAYSNEERRADGWKRINERMIQASIRWQSWQSGVMVRRAVIPVADVEQFVKKNVNCVVRVAAMRRRRQRHYGISRPAAAAAQARIAHHFNQRREGGREGDRDSAYLPKRSTLASRGTLLKPSHYGHHRLQLHRTCLIWA